MKELISIAIILVLLVVNIYIHIQKITPREVKEFRYPLVEDPNKRFRRPVIITEMIELNGKYLIP